VASKHEEEEKRSTSVRHLVQLEPEE